MSRTLLRFSWPKSALIFWSILVVVLAIKTAAWPDKHSVYPSYALTAWEWLQGDPIGTSDVAHIYLPIFADLMVPFAVLPLGLGGLLWSLGSVLAMLTGLKAFLDEMPEKTWLAEERAWMFLLAPWLGLESLFNGQANVMILACLLWATVAIRRQQWWLAAGLLALPGFKCYTLAYGMLLSALHPRQLAARFTLGVILLLGLPFVFHPAADVLLRFQEIVHYLAKDSHDFSYNVIGLRPLLALWGALLDPRLFFLMQTISGGLLLLILLRLQLAGMPSRSLLLQAFLLTTLWFMVLGPSVEPPTILLASVSIAWIVLESLRQEGAWLEKTALIAIAILVGPLQTSILGREVQRWIVDHKLAGVGLCLLLVRQVGINLLGAQSGTESAPAAIG